VEFCNFCKNQARFFNVVLHGREKMGSLANELRPGHAHFEDFSATDIVGPVFAM